MLREVREKIFVSDKLISEEAKEADDENENEEQKSTGEEN